MLLQLIIISFALAMDAVSVSIAGGIDVKRERNKHALRVGLFFGVFQAVMPLLGWFVGQKVTTLVTTSAPWIAFFLLSGIGLVMVKEAIKEEKEEKKSILSNKTLFLLAVATSIDAFVVGISLGLIKIPLLLSVSIIGLITFGLSLLGFLFGSHLNRYFGGKLGIVGGIALVLLGVKILFSAFW